jgi:signal peptidase I
MNQEKTTLIIVAEFIWEMIKTALTVIIIVYLIKTYVFQLFIVDGQSMEPNLHHNQMLLVDEFSYHFRAPARGEVIVFQKPNEPSPVNFIKRVIGLPHEKVIIKDSHVLITNPTNNEVILQEDYLTSNNITNGSQEFTLGDNEVFVLGDNRTNSQDSRVIGPISYDLIAGRALFTYWPIKEAYWLFTPTYNLSFISWSL